MYKLFIIPAFSLFFCCNAFGQLNDFLSSTDAFLKTYVHDGKVDYEGISKNMTEIENLYSTIKHMDVSGMNTNQKKAFYVNSYNLLVIYMISRNIENLSTTQGFDGFFDKFQFMVANKPVTLNQLEIKYLLIPFKDARLHFALACGAKGCPKLASYAFTPSNIENQLNERAEISLNDDYFIRLKSADNKLMVSKLFKWYEKDFLRDSPNVVAFINKYRSEKVPSSFAVGYYEYDWNLNKLN